jgi:hypothetical protein
MGFPRNNVRRSPPLNAQTLNLEALNSGSFVFQPSFHLILSAISEDFLPVRKMGNPLGNSKS